MPGLNNEAFGRIDGVATKSSRSLADELGTHKETITAVKAGRRGMSAELAKSVAMKSGEKAATLFVTSAATALKQKMRAETITLMGVVDAAQMALKAVSTKFTPDQIDRREPEFRQAVLELRTAAHKALELLGDTEYVENVHATGDSVEVALKSRDLHGRAVEEGPALERDPLGRRIKD
jgi:plasmid maintenance system antidote protein VapI